MRFIFQSPKTITICDYIREKYFITYKLQDKIGIVNYINPTLTDRMQICTP